MTLENTQSTSITQGVILVPAPGAEEQKPNEARDVFPTQTPATDADENKTEGDKAVTETPEQIEAKKESRRARQNARRAQVLSDAKAEAKFYKEQLEKTQTKPDPQDGEPRRDDPKYADNYELYLEDRAEWRADRKVDARLRERDGEQQKRTLTQAQEKVARDWTKREQEFEARVPNYGNIVGEFVEEGLDDFSPQARQAIVEGGPQLLHYLATNLEEADRIAALSPSRQAMELGKLEDKIAKPALRTTNAPSPVKPVSSRATSEKNPEKMSDEEYRTWRASHGASWAKR